MACCEKSFRSLGRFRGVGCMVGVIKFQFPRCQGKESWKKCKNCQKGGNLARGLFKLWRTVAAIGGDDFVFFLFVLFFFFFGFFEVVKNGGKESKASFKKIRRDVYLSFDSVFSVRVQVKSHRIHVYLHLVYFSILIVNVGINKCHTGDVHGT